MEGLVHIYTGDGKGKTTAAMGLACRAVGAGLKVLVVQFLKGRDTGELSSLKKLGIPVLRTEVTKFISYMTDAERADCKKQQEACFVEAKKQLAAYDLVVFDEIIGAVAAQMLSLEEVLACVQNKPAGTELVLTGRNAPKELVDLADYVSEIKGVKHPFAKGIKARKGIEF